uniref:PAS domain-containing protein n=1 Tax=Macrostomum lignano TaxID=282301 RepID=A0A1I8FIE9_9PLAT
YTNPAHDKMFGRSAGESQRCNSFDAMFVDKTEDEMRSLLQSLRKGKEWIGSATGKRKSGATFQHQCCCISNQGQARHYVSIRQSLNGAEPQTEPLQQQSKDSAASGHDKDDVEPTPAAYSNLLLMQRSRSEMLSGLRLVQPLIAGQCPARPRAPLDERRGGGGGGGKTAASRIGSTDLPMQKVSITVRIEGAGLLGQARDGSQSPAAAAALDRALELLRQAGGDQQQPPLDPGDRMASDYVGGLMTGGSKPSDKKRSSLQARRYHRPSEIMAEQISRVLGLALCL